MEKMKRAGKGLLENISFETGCSYLSDLHQPRLLPRIRQVVRGLPPGQFSLEEWNDAVTYITGKTLLFASPEEAASYLVQYQAPTEH